MAQLSLIIDLKFVITSPTPNSHPPHPKSPSQMASNCGKHFHLMTSSWQWTTSGNYNYIVADADKW